jgi:NADH dehydrogenase [ubiquinone] 1 alpha subcomplex assembly factor 6
MSSTLIPQSNLSHCAAAVQTQDSDRFLTVLFAPASARDALFAIYAFNCEIAKIHESVREPMIAEIRFQWWRDAISGIFAGQSSRHPVVLALQDIVEYHDLSRDPFEELLEARAVDISLHRPKTYVEFTEFSGSISMPLMTLALNVLGVNKGELEGDISTGAVAWGLTELLRKIPHNLKTRRSYLPTEMLTDFGVIERDLSELRPSANISNLIRHISEDVASKANCARGKLSSIDRKGLSPLLCISLARQYTRRFSRLDYDPFHSDFSKLAPLRGWNLAYRSLTRQL